VKTKMAGRLDAAARQVGEDSVEALDNKHGSTESPTVELAEDWQAFCTLDTQSKVFGVKASAALILSGAELERLHAKYAIGPGGDHSRTRAGMLWPEMAEKYGRISEDTATRRRKLALAATAYLPLLQEVLAGEADPRQLSATKKLALEKGLQALTTGKTQRQLMWEFGLGPKPKGRVGFRPNAEMVQAWLAKQHPERKGAAYEDLPPEVRKEFKKQYRAPGLTRAQESEMKREWWRQHGLGLSEELMKKSYNELDARDRQWIALVYYDGWKALSAGEKTAAEESAVDKDTTTQSTQSTNKENGPA
jgi:hypothetical protein